MGEGYAVSRDGGTEFKDFCPNCHYCRNEAAGNCIIVKGEEAEREYDTHLRDHRKDDGFMSTTVRS